MEVAKFVFTAIGTFLSVFGLCFSIFQYWRKQQENKMSDFKADVHEDLEHEIQARKEDAVRIEKRIDALESTLVQSMQQRMSNIEGELKGMRPILQAIQNWFINNTPKGKE